VKWLLAGGAPEAPLVHAQKRLSRPQRLVLQPHPRRSYTLVLGVAQRGHTSIALTFSVISSVPPRPLRTSQLLTLKRQEPQPLAEG